MQWWKKAIIYAVAIVVVYFAGFFTKYAIDKRRAMEFSNVGIASIEVRNESIADGIIELSDSESIIEDGIRDSKYSVERSINIVNESTDSNRRSIDIVESANERIKRIEYGLNELYKLQLEAEEKE